MMKIRRGRLNLGPMKGGVNATTNRRRLAKVVEAHRTGRLDVFKTAEGGLRMIAVPKRVRKARAARKAQRRARRITRMHAR